MAKNISLDPDDWSFYWIWNCQKSRKTDSGSGFEAGIITSLEATPPMLFTGAQGDDGGAGCESADGGGGGGGGGGNQEGMTNESTTMKSTFASLSLSLSLSLLSSFWTKH